MKTTYYNHNDFQTSRARDLQLHAQLHAIGNCNLVQDNLFIEGKATARQTFQAEEYCLQSGHQGIGDVDVLAGVHLELVIKKDVSQLLQINELAGSLASAVATHCRICSRLSYGPTVSLPIL